MAYTQRITVRFDDVDYARIVYFPKLFAYCHAAFEDFFGVEMGIPYAKMLQDRQVGFPVVRATADFKSPLRFGDTCRVVMEAAAMGDKSLSCRYQLFQGDTEQLCARVDIVTVAISMETFTGIEIPPDVRAAFERHRISPPL